MNLMFSVEVLLAPSCRFPSFCLPPRSWGLSHCFFYAKYPLQLSPLKQRLHLFKPSALSNSIYSDEQTWLEVDKIEICILSGLLGPLYQIHAAHTSFIALTLLYQNDCWLPVSLTLLWMWQRCFINTCISRNYSGVGLEWAHQSHEHRNKCFFQALNTPPGRQREEEEKAEILKSDKPGPAIQLLHACGSFILTCFTGLRGFNEIIT